MEEFKHCCIVCRKEAVKEIKGSHFCSSACLGLDVKKKIAIEDKSPSGQRLYPRNCVDCSKKFISTNREHYFCTDGCFYKHIGYMWTECKSSVRITASTCSYCKSRIEHEPRRKRIPFCDDDCERMHEIAKRETKRKRTALMDQKAREKIKEQAKTLLPKKEKLPFWKVQELLEKKDQKARLRAFNRSIAHKPLQSNQGWSSRT